MKYGTANDRIVQQKAGFAQLKKKQQIYEEIKLGIIYTLTYIHGESV